MQSVQHGRIACGTISVRDLDASLALYRDALHQHVLDVGQVSDELARAWGAPRSRGARYAILNGGSDTNTALRLIEGPQYNSHVPATSIGWNAFELTVRDVFALAKELAGSGFEVVGPPKLVDGFTSFIPMQVFGPDGEVLFLNQVNHSDEDADLPKTTDVVGDIFIVVLASSNRERDVADYVRCLDLHRAATHSLRYSLINRAFSFPADTTQTITMVQRGRTPFAQIDEYPASAPPRSQQAGWLPAGNAIVSVYVDEIDALPLADMGAGVAVAPPGTIYDGRKTQVIRGSSTELIELIEIGRSH
ncbi:MAG: VOC family protein [Gammaproteobacteria bacterium]